MRLGLPFLYSLLIAFLFGAVIQLSIFLYFDFATEFLWIDKQNVPVVRQHSQGFPLGHVVSFPVAAVLAFLHLGKVIRNLSAKHRLGVFQLLSACLSIFFVSSLLVHGPFLFFSLLGAKAAIILLASTFFTSFHLGLTYGAFFAISLVFLVERDQPGIWIDWRDEAIKALLIVGAFVASVIVWQFVYWPLWYILLHMSLF